MRDDLNYIAQLINPGARVLDLGCGEGELLAWLQSNKGVNGYGLDVDATNINTCLRHGVNVIEQDLDAGLDNFADNSFDMVIMTETLQSVKAPDHLVEEMLRIGEECIITFPNFGHWQCRTQLMWRGTMPVSEHLPHAWFDTPNIHMCTFKDFERLCADLNVHVIQRRVLGSRRKEGFLTDRMPNLLGSVAFYRLGRKAS